MITVIEITSGGLTKSQISSQVGRLTKNPSLHVRLEDAPILAYTRTMVETTKTIEISHDTTMDVQEFKEAISQSFNTIEDMYNVTGLWIADTIYELSGTSIQGTVRLVNHRVVVKLTLGLLLIPFAGTIKNMVATALKDRLK
jgi:putative polyhydroxyalkanoate system protein